MFGAFVAALISIPAAGALQVLVRELWQATAAPPLIEGSGQESSLAQGSGQEQADRH